MEKLQKAIAKARSERRANTTGSPPPQQPVATPEPSPARHGNRALWSALSPMEFKPGHLRRGRILSYSPNHESTPFDVLRTKVMQQMRQNKWTRLMVTSPTPECGKTTVVANIAFGIARQAEQYAVVFDCDLRKPNLAAVCGVRPRHDIRSLFMGETPFSEQAVRLGDTVALSLASSRSVDPVRYLGSQTTEEVINDIEARYAPDITIFDTSPFLVSDDARIMMSKVDCAIIIAKADRTTEREIDICEREISQHTNVMGVVLNQCRFADEAQGYGYEYY